MPYKIVNGKPKFYPEMVVKQDEKWREQAHKEFYERFGHWYWFTYKKYANYTKSWLEQFDRSNNEQEQNNG